MSAPVGLQINFLSTFGQADKLQFLLADYAEAKAVFDKLHDAATAYHGRANDRERIISFVHLSGEASVDIQAMSSVAIDDPLGVNREALEAWNCGLAEVQAKAKAAGDAVSKAEG